MMNLIKITQYFLTFDLFFEKYKVRNYYETEYQLIQKQVK